MSNLPDLDHLVSTTKTRLAAIDPNRVISMTETNWDKLKSALKGQIQGTSSVDVIGGHTIVITNSNTQKAFISVQELPALTILAEYLAALNVYGDAVNDLAVGMGYRSSQDPDPQCAEIFKHLPSLNWNNDLSSSDLQRLKAQIAAIPDPVDQQRMEKFLSDPTWGARLNSKGEVGKKLNRDDWTETPVKTVGNFIIAASQYRPHVVTALENAKISFGDLVQNISSPPPVSGIVAENRLYFGAPGTGKSKTIRDIVPADRQIKTVFHADFQNSDFMGALKPKMVSDPKSKELKISYEFRPGPFARVLQNSLANPEEHWFLVIEELNRAHAAAVFGEIFQLLDRDSDGRSEYEIDFPDDDFKSWLNSHSRVNVEQLYLPNNLSILASMNSADQGVVPIDGAFRRRWRQKHIRIDFTHAPRGDFELVDLVGNARLVEWKDFAPKLNTMLLNKLDVAEDRLFGPWFVSKEELAASDKLPEKIYSYLWDDLLRHNPKTDLFAAGLNSFGQLALAVETGEKVFCDDFLKEF